MGPLMLDLEGTELTAEERGLLQQRAVGGVILFTRNFASVNQLQQLVAAIRQTAERDLLIAVDHEGGRVQRFREGFTKVPAMGAILPAHNHDITAATAGATELGWLMATELLACDIDISFAPVLDINGVSEVIGDRAFAADAESVTPMAGAFALGMQQAGMATTGKHFPGHGSVRADSHIAIPVDERSQDAIFATDLPPFKQLIHAGRIDALMPAHVIYPQVDPNPAGFSPFWLQQVLRQDLGFDGVIFSDDLSMQGASVAGDFTERAHQALAAGCDMVLVCNHREGAQQVLEALKHRAENSRLMRLRRQASVSWGELKQQPRWQAAKALAERIRAD